MGSSVCQILQGNFSLLQFKFLAGGHVCFHAFTFLARQVSVLDEL